jgi:hypothetical protein
MEPEALDGRELAELVVDVIRTVPFSPAARGSFGRQCGDMQPAVRESGGGLRVSDLSHLCRRITEEIELGAKNFGSRSGTGRT